ncbi:hypothetical protein N1851_006405 [Merluccius polli]|uniref:Uncharacterized protein n=1 Tax=Merluccius polli TaxID=89951 RepID=A0AA47N4Q7_MERPO|nr:hypothetical protein N1851_006405 [Merluccius polli]
MEGANKYDNDICIHCTYQELRFPLVCSQTPLGFLATGSFQRELADRSGMSQGALSRAIAAVLNGIIRISARYTVSI